MQQAKGSAPPAVVPGPRRSADGRQVVASTVVLPYLESTTGNRWRPLRAWMLTMPVDLVAMLAPLLVSTQNWKGMIFAAVLTVVIFAAGGLYQGRRHMSILDELPGLCMRLFASAAVVGIIAAQRHSSLADVGPFMRNIALSALLVIVGRAVTINVVLLARRRRWVEHNAIVIGGGPVAVELARLLRRYPQYGLRFAGFVDDASTPHPDAEQQPLIGHLADLDEMVRLTKTDVIIVADVDTPDADLIELVRRPQSARCDLWVVPRLRDFPVQSAPDHIGAIPVVRARRSTLSGWKWLVKRTTDVVVAVLALLLLSPVLLVCALLVRVEGGPGIFFRQQRIGQYGRPFDVIKFRSMRPADDAESQTRWSVADDPRVGPIGRFLRRTSLDELPQLWNILRGDMTFVGPRPERPFFVERFSADHPEYAMRHRVPVGLTGLAQVSGLRGDTPISDRARFDNYYIENWSLWLDVKVVLRTVAEVFRGAGR
ncbi:exopolysaccharide biosynthesis polyprenyl glycosylphosphotransferase [Spirilliplanes yamanashiensis]|nr:sugar transferase [Spirilliplanes yamanashiensis]MDP9814746.1 exopolysaccharide biosynthesis polyprenyl glycosylphosphotransferase [Spirilliplanes yamanashiensis]